MKITTNFIKQTKRHLSASGSILLPLALKWRLVAFIAGVILAVLVTPCLAPHMVSAASITLTVPKEPLTFSITPSDGGTFGKSAAGTIKIQTDALAGYTLNIKAKDGKADLTNEATDDKISPISDNVSENDFTSTAAYNNMWGFSFNKQGASSNVFHSIPGGAVGAKIGSTEVPNTAEDIYNIVLGARVDNSLATGAYSNTFIVVASANPVPYKVKYESNAGSDSVSGMPGNNTSATTSTQSFALPSEEPERTGYEFIGWCDKTTAKETGVDICPDGTSYQSSDTYTLSKKDEDVTFYAMWAEESNIMQNWKGCSDLQESTATESHEVTLIDARDNRPYYVAKLADGHCWMTEDLDLNIESTKTYTAMDTDLGYATDDGQGVNETGTGKYTWTPDKSTYRTGDTTWNKTNANSNLDVTKIGDYIAQSYDPGDICWNGVITTVDNSESNSVTSRYIVPCSKHQGANAHYHVGNYYNFGAAVAQNNTSSKQDNMSGYSTSICPAGWQLPNPSGDRSATELNNNAKTKGSEILVGTSGNIHLAPYYYHYSGYWHGSYFRNGYANWYRTGFVGSKTESKAAAYLGSSKVWSTNTGSLRWDGLLVRCVSRQ